MIHGYANQSYRPTVKTCSSLGNEEAAAKTP